MTLDRAGITFMETLITIAILSIVTVIGSTIIFNSYNANALKSQRDVIIDMLEKARNEAMSNLNEAPRGFSVQTGNYVIFQGSSYAARSVDLDEKIEKSSSIAVSGVTEIVFNQLRGDVSSGAGDMIISSGVTSLTVSINSEGGLSW